MAVRGIFFDRVCKYSLHFVRGLCGIHRRVDQDVDTQTLGVDMGGGCRNTRGMLDLQLLGNQFVITMAPSP